MDSLSIRAVTAGIPIDSFVERSIRSNYIDFNRYFTNKFSKSGIPVRTNRICLSPINSKSGWISETVCSIVNAAQDLVSGTGVRWICVPFDFTSADVRKEHSNLPLQIIKQYKNCFVNILIAKNKNINVAGVQASSALIKNVSRLSPNGFDNFRLGIGVNCPKNIPFFPFSYNEGSLGFSLAIETLLPTINIARNLGSNYSIERFNILFKNEMISQLEKISSIGLDIEQQTGFEFRGVDISLAPFPGESSIVELMELMGLEVLGGRGTVFIISLLTDLLRDVLKVSGIRCAGFNGVMFSLLEDSGLAKRNNQRMFDIDSLLLYSTVCGCGLDMVPLPGDVLEDELSGLIFDLAALSINLNKPLGLRVLPIPDSSTNEITDFNYDFMINTRIKEMKNAGIDPRSIDGLIQYQSLRKF